MQLRIEHGTLIVHRDGRAVVLPDHTVNIQDGSITGIHPSGSHLDDFHPEGRKEDHPPAVHSEPIEPDETIDATRHLVIPGLINTHHHLYQSLTRGLKASQDASLFDWLGALYPRWAGLDYEAVRLASEISLAELLLSGCTTTSDHFYLFPQGSDVTIEAVLEAANRLGMRIHACRGSMSVGQSKGGLPPDVCVQTEEAILADCQRVIERFHDPRRGAMRRIDLAPCSPFSVSAELLRDTAVLARQCGVLLHTHAAETLDEQRYCRDRFGMRPIAWLDKVGWLGPDVYLAHGVHLDDADIRRLAVTRTGIVHCPCSNARLGSGIGPLRRLLDAGAKVGLGVDGSSSNDGGHLLGEARQALLLQRARGGAKALSVSEAFTLVTHGGAMVLNRPELGNIDAGYAADIAMFRRDDIALAGAVEQDPLGALVLCRVARADCVIVNGRTVVREGQITGVELPVLIERFNRLVREMFSD